MFELTLENFIVESLGTDKDHDQRTSIAPWTLLTLHLLLCWSSWELVDALAFAPTSMSVHMIPVREKLVSKLNCTNLLSWKNESSVVVLRGALPPESVHCNIHLHLHTHTRAPSFVVGLPYPAKLQLARDNNTAHVLQCQCGITGSVFVPGRLTNEVAELCTYTCSKSPRISRAIKYRLPQRCAKRMFYRVCHFHQ